MLATINNTAAPNIIGPHQDHGPPLTVCIIMLKAANPVRSAVTPYGIPAEALTTWVVLVSCTCWRRRRRGGWPALSGGFSRPVPEHWVPRPCVLCKGGYRCCRYHGLVMPSGLHRTYGAHHLHFITCSCYRRLPFLSSARARDRFLAILEQTRER
jgi:hypothetical protein